MPFRFFLFFFEVLFRKMVFIGVDMVISGTVVFIDERFGAGDKDIYGMRCRDALFIGLCQSIAIAPGISRSGSTLVGGLFSGLNRPLAVKFAFLMSIPPIAASGIKELISALGQGLGGVSPVALILGVLVSFVSGFLAIKWMIKVVTDKRLFYFSIYTWAAGVLVAGLALKGIL